MTSISPIRASRPAFERTVLAVFGFALVVLVQSSWRWTLVHPVTSDYLIVVSIAAVAVFARLRLREEFGFSTKPPLGTLAVWFVMAGGVVGCAMLLANAVLDHGPAREFTTLAVGEHCSGRSPDITVRGAPTLPVRASTMRVNIFHPSCRATRDGDTIIVVVAPGYFGRAWIKDARRVQGQGSDRNTSQ
jgi:hypothetical protein